MKFSFKRTYKNLMRVKEILQVLSKHGFGHIISQLNLPHYIPSLRHFKPSNALPLYIPEDTMALRARLAFQELGPTFVKLGQIFSGRPDLFPDAFIQEFKKLQDDVPPFPREEAFAVVEKELGAPAHQIFPYFNENVLASGSIAQVHEARLPDGQEVIVKIKRPGINKIIATDVAILRFLADLIEKYVEELEFMQPGVIVDEFSKGIRKELDFILEASYCEKFSALLKDNPKVNSPDIFWQYSTSNLLTLQKLKGHNIGDLANIQKKGIDPKGLARDLTSIFMKQYFVWGLFHADPHPGNILVSDDGVINLIDFGSVGHLSNELKSQLSTTVLALMDTDLDLLIEVYGDIGVFTGSVNTRELKADILEVLDKYFYTPFEHLNFKNVFEDIVQISWSHKVILPREFIVFAKSLVTVTGLAQELDPEFNLGKAAAPHITSILQEKFSPKRMLSLSWVTLWSLTSLLQRLPSEAKEFLRRFKEGNLKVTIKHEVSAKYFSQVEKMSNRLVVSIIMGSIIIGASLLSMAQVGPTFHGLSILGIVGYVMATFLGLCLTISMMRSGRL